MAMDEKDFSELVRSSRTYRRFSGERVPMETLRGLIDVVRFAPTGNNTQLLRFALINDPQTVAGIARHHGWAALLPDFVGPGEGELPGAYIGICGPAGSSKVPLRNIDAGIAAQTICLAAAAEGLGACIIKSFTKKAEALVGVDKSGHDLLLLIALGKPAADEHVELEPATTEHGLKYWRSGTTHHVPKLEVDDLIL